METRTQLKTYYETGDVPTEPQYASLIDSLLHPDDLSRASAFDELAYINLPASTDTKLTISSTNYTNGITVSTVNNRLTVSNAGYYRIVVQFGIRSNSTGDGYNDIKLYQNGVAGGGRFTSKIKSESTANGYVTKIIAWDYPLVASDYIEVFINPSVAVDIEDLVITIDRIDW